MARILLSLLFAAGLSLWCLGWMRRRLTDGFRRRRGQLDSKEHDRLRRIAKRSPPLRRALDLRKEIMQTLERRRDPANIRARVDAAVRRLAEQLNLRTRIEQALASSTDLQVDTSALTFGKGAPLEAMNPDAILERLEQRLEILDADREHTLRELSNIQLALLDLTASETILARDQLTEALEELETEGFSARGREEAEKEVSQLIAKRHHPPALSEGASAEET